MCLVVLAWQSHPRYRLIVAANRDEFHDRPTAPLGWWPDDSRILAGRNLCGSGRWLGAARCGRFGVVTNFRELERPAGNAPSRGDLVTRFLSGTTSPQEYLDDLRRLRKAKERELLGELITDWIRSHPDHDIVDKIVTQSSDSEFHCLTIVIFYKERAR